MAVDRLMGDIEPAAGEAVEQCPSICPGKRSQQLVVILQIRARVKAGALPDQFVLACPSRTSS